MLLTEVNKIPQLVKVQIFNQKVSILEEGIGMALNIGGSPGSDTEGCFPAIEDKEHWQIILDGLSYLRAGWLGIRMPGELIMPKKGAINSEAEVLGRLNHFHQWAKARGVNIALDFGPIPSWLTFKNAQGSRPAPSNLEIYTSDYAARLLNYLISERDYCQIKYFSCFCEPFNEDAGNFTFGTPEGIDPYAYYVRMNKFLRGHLDKIGLDERKLRLIGPTSHDLYPCLLERFEEKQLDFASSVYGFDSHVYRYRFDYLPPAHHVPTDTLSEIIEHYVKAAVQYARDKDKSYFLTEIGCMYYGKSNYGDNRGPGRHESFIGEAELIIRCLNIGVAGFTKWAYLFNPRGTHGFYQLLNTFDGSYSKQENFYGYAMLCPCLSKGSIVLKTSVDSGSLPYQYVHSAAVKSKDRNITILLVNNHPAEQFDVEISFEGLSEIKMLHKWVTDFWDKYRRQQDPYSNGDFVRTRVFPLSFTVLTTLDLCK